MQRKGSRRGGDGGVNMKYSVLHRLSENIPPVDISGLCIFPRKSLYNATNQVIAYYNVGDVQEFIHQDYHRDCKQKLRLGKWYEVS